MAASRCDTCLTNWPLSAVGVCPDLGCDGKLSRSFGESPIPQAEATSRINRANFKMFLEAETDEQRECRQKKFEDEQAALFADQLEQL